MEYSIRRNRNDEWIMELPHQHNSIEILLSLTDGGNFFLMNDRYPLRRGTLVLMQNQVLHKSISADCVYERYVLHIPRRTLEEASTIKTNFLSLITGNCCLQLDDESFLELKELMDKCYYRTDGIGDDVLEECAFLSLLVALGRLFARLSAFSSPSDKLSAPVRRAVNMIDSHLSDDLSLQALSELCYVSKYHLCRMFKEETGFTVGEYIVRKRLHFAASLLQKGENVQKSGEEAGFRSYSHFIRTFSNLMGISPGKYQRQYRKNTKAE